MLWIMSNKLAQASRPQPIQTVQTEQEIGAESPPINQVIVALPASLPATVTKSTTDDDAVIEERVREKILPEYITKDTEATEENTRENSLSAEIAAIPKVAEETKDNKIPPADIATGNKPVMVDEKWLTQLNPSHYIIQYGSTVDVELLSEFIPIISNDEEIAIYPYRKTPSGRMVYGIATGVYDDMETALAALEQISTEARAYGPWVRQVRKVVSEINSVAKKAS